LLTVYSKEGCPRCKVLKMKLDKKGIPYEECHDIDYMRERGMMSLPVLGTDDRLLTFDAAVRYVNSLETGG